MRRTSSLSFAAKVAAPIQSLLLLSIHDVGPRSEGAVDRLRDHLGRHASPDRLALLVVPNHWGEAPIRAGSPFADAVAAVDELNVDEALSLAQTRCFTIELAGEAYLQVMQRLTLHGRQCGTDGPLPVEAHSIGKVCA